MEIKKSKERKAMNKNTRLVFKVLGLSLTIFGLFLFFCLYFLKFIGFL